MPDDVCPPLFGRDDRYQYDRAVLPPVQPETNKKERRYSDDGHDVGIHQHVVVHSTRLSPCHSDAYEERCISQACFPADRSRTRVRPEEEQECFPANYNPVTARPEEHSIREAENTHSAPGVERPRQIAVAGPDLEQDIDLNESADLFLEESRWSTNATIGDSILSERSISRNRTDGTRSPENFVSSLLLLLFPLETGSLDGIRSNREMASPSCMASGNLNTGPAIVWTGDNNVEETTVTKYTTNKCINDMYESNYTGNKKGNEEQRTKVTGVDRTFASTTLRTETGNSNNGNPTSTSIRATSIPHIVNDLTVDAETADRETVAGRKTGNTVFATAPSSSATRIKCSKNEDHNNHFRPRTTERKDKKPFSRKRRNEPCTYEQYNSMIHKMPDIAAKCEDSVRKCKRALKDMSKLLRTSRIENFWLRWNLQEMGPRFSQSEHNATFMMTGVRTPLSRAATAAYTPRPHMFTPTSGNVKSTTPSTATARLRSSPPTCACPPGPTSCQASRGYDKLRRQPHHFIRSHTVRESTPIYRTSMFTVPMSTPIRSSFQSSTNSSLFSELRTSLTSCPYGKDKTDS